MAAGRLWNRTLSAATVDSEARVLRLFRQLTKWDRLEHLFRAIITSVAVRDFALEELVDWSKRFNRAFTTLTTAQHPRLTALFAATKPMLSPETGAEIEFVLRHG